MTPGDLGVLLRIYIGASDLGPEVNRHRSATVNFIHFGSFVAGVGLLWASRAVSGADVQEAPCGLRVGHRRTPDRHEAPVPASGGKLASTA